MLDALPVAGLFDQDAAHRLGGGVEEVLPALESHPAPAEQTQVRLMNQGGRLERVIAPLLRHLPAGELAELCVHRRDQVR
jgi:hypothetical protein